MFKFLTLLAMLATSASAFADSGSAFFYQAPNGKHQLTPAIDYDSRLLRLESMTTNNTQRSHTAGEIFLVDYEYGLNDLIAIGVDIYYLDARVSSNVDGSSNTWVSGFSDPKFHLAGTQPFSTGILKYGGDLAISISDHEIKENGNVNVYTGATILTPYIGYEIPLSNEIIGAKVSQDILVTKRDWKVDNTNGSTSAKIKGGEQTTVTAFYEHRKSEDERYGLKFDYININKFKGNDSGDTYDLTSPLYTFTAYGQFDAGRGQLLPQIAYSITSESTENGNNTDSFSDWNFGVGYRLTFN